MSVYRRKGSPFFSFNFIYRGTRFSGSTGCTNRRDAEAVEREKRAGARQAVSIARQPMTVDQACGRYWDEIGQHAASSSDIDWSCRYLIRQLGPNTPIKDICDSDVAALVARRRADPVSYPKALKGKRRTAKRISSATVNRSVIDPLRRILRRAQDAWNEPVGKINWRTHRLAEPKERVRYMTPDEEQGLFAALHPAYHPAIRFALISGCRAKEFIRLTWNDIDLRGRRITIRGKGTSADMPKIATIPISQAMMDILTPLRAKAASGGLQTLSGAQVFRNAAGQPATYRSVSAAFVTACKRAGISDLRLHDLRHTAATRLLRQTGNLKLVQKLLRHSDIGTTAKYAHVQDDDLREAMDALSATKVTSKIAT